MADFEYESVRPYLEIPGSIDYDDGVQLFELALKGPGGNEPVVELGCFKGRATAFMARACSLDGRGSVIAVDDFSQYAKEIDAGREVDVGAILYKNLYKHRVSPWCIIMEGTSPKVVALLDRPIRMLYMGGSRQYDALKEEFEVWAPHLIGGGLAVFPGFRDPEYPDVERFFVDTEYAGAFAMSRIWGGFGVLRKK